MQGMPEWDLVTDDPVPNFGILPPEDSTKVLADELTEKIKLTEEVSVTVDRRSVASRPSSALASRRSAVRSVVSPQTPKAVSSSPQILHREQVKKLSVGDTHRFILQRSKVTEASWVVNKPNARIQNKSKKKYSIKPFRLLVLNRIEKDSTRT